LIVVLPLTGNLGSRASLTEEHPPALFPLNRICIIQVSRSDLMVRTSSSRCLIGFDDVIHGENQLAPACLAMCGGLLNVQAEQMIDLVTFPLPHRLAAGSSVERISGTRSGIRGAE
jgi:hypothetical protein